MLSALKASIPLRIEKLAERKLVEWPRVGSKGKTSFEAVSVLPDIRPAHLPQIPRQSFLCPTEASAQTLISGPTDSCFVVHIRSELWCDARSATGGATWSRRPPKPRDPGLIHPLLDHDFRPAGNRQGGLSPCLAAKCHTCRVNAPQPCAQITIILYYCKSLVEFASVALRKILCMAI